MGLQGGGGFTVARLNPLVLTEAGGFTHTGDTTETLLRTYTVTKGSAGSTICFITYEITNDGASAYVRAKKGTQQINSSTDVAFLEGVEVIGENTSGSTDFASFAVTIANGDTINLYGKIANGAKTVTLQNVNIFCSDVNTTFAGS